MLLLRKWYRKRRQRGEAARGSERRQRRGTVRWGSKRQRDEAAARDSEVRQQETAKWGSGKFNGWQPPQLPLKKSNGKHGKILDHIQTMVNWSNKMIKLSWRWIQILSKFNELNQLWRQQQPQHQPQKWPPHFRLVWRHLPQLLWLLHLLQHGCTAKASFSIASATTGSPPAFDQDCDKVKSSSNKSVLDDVDHSMILKKSTWPSWTWSLPTKGESTFVILWWQWYS